MKRLAEKLKTKSFWAGLVGAVFLMLAAFGVDMGGEASSAAISGVCSALTLIGVISPGTDKSDKADADKTDTPE